jgi:hypothetical protein
MLRKLLIFILTFWLAAPAIAAPACHDVAAPAPQMMLDQSGGEHATHHIAPQIPTETIPDQTSPDQMRQAHICIGCAVPMTGAALMDRSMLIPMVHWVEPSTGLAALSRSPDTPPPRRLCLSRVKT